MRTPRERPLGGFRALAVFSALISSAILLAPAGGFPTPGSSVGVDMGPGYAQTPSLAVDATGLIHLVRSDNSSGERGVHYTRSGDGVTWTPSVRIDQPGSAALYPRIAVERESVGIRGRLYVAYQVGTLSAADVWFTVSDGGAFWSLPRRVDSGPVGSGSMAPSIAASNVRVYVAWQDDRTGVYHIFVRTSADGSATWGPEIQVSAGGIAQNLQVRVDAKGDTAVVVWRQSDAATVSIRAARSEDGGATWRSSIVAYGSLATLNLRDPDVFLDELGIAHVVWAHADASRSGHVHYAWSADGAAWSSPLPVDHILGIANAGGPSISGIAGTLWVAWHDTRDGDSDVYAAWSADGVTWGDPPFAGADLRVDDTDRNGNPGDDGTTQASPTLRTGGIGVYVAWEDSRNSAATDVYFGEVAVSPLVITELQDEPTSEARVEIYNFARTPFSLTGASLTAGSTTVDLSPLGSIGGRAHIAIGAAATSDLVVGLDMGSDGARVQIERAGEILASAGSGMFGVAPDPLPAESTARYAGSLDYSAAWTRATSPSFRARNTVLRPDLAPALVLNEVLFNPSASGERFVELYLRGGAALDLTGYRIVSDAIFTFSGGTVGPMNPYVFLFEGRSPGWFAPLDPARDNVYLYDPGGRLLDMVGWAAPHTAGRSVSRTTSGVGGIRGFDESTDAANGWAFDQEPSLALVLLESDQRVMADIGTTVQFLLTATNLQPVPEYLNIGATSVLTNWPVSLHWTNGTPLTDSAGDPDSIPDVGLVNPGAAWTFLAEVSIPVEAPLGDGNTVTVSASAASVPVGRDSATLWIDLYPHFDVTRIVDPASVYLQGSGPPYNEVAQITVTVTGAGLPIVQAIPQDVVFQIDESGSMNGNDPTNLRVEAVKSYIDEMRVDDRATTVGFTDVAWVVNNRPLTPADAMGKAILKMDADTLACSPGCNGWTNIENAIQLANNVLIAQGNRSRPRIEILLTDGDCLPTPCTNMNIIDQAAAEGIVIYTIGLGDAVDTTYLQSVADRTGGKYYRASTPQDLIWIYEEIGLRINRTAGIDPDVTDNAPMIEDHVTHDLAIDPSSFYDPATGMPRPPSFMQQLGDRTRIQWNVSRIEINETWSVRYSVTSSRPGVQDVAVHPDARVAYLRWDSSIVSQPIPQGTLEVLAPTSPPHLTLTNPPHGAMNVDLAQMIAAVFDQDMDAATVRWAILPSITATPVWIGRVLTLGHDGLAACTPYTVEITEARDTDGEDLEPGPVPNPWAFTTVCATYAQYTISRSPVVGDVWVDDVPYPVPVTFTWPVASFHRLVAPDLDPPLGPSRLVFDAWDDGGARDHMIIVGAADLTIIAVYDWQHRVDLTLVGLRTDRPAGVRYVLWGTPSSAASSAAWSEFADHGSAVDVDPLISGGARERFITEDETAWIVTGPLTKVVRYHHQFDAIVTLVGLEGHEVGVDFTSLNRPSTTLAGRTWNAWVDAGHPVRVDEDLSIGPRERYRTLNTSHFDVDEPLDATIMYIHQFQVRVTLVGTDANHTVGAAWTSDRAAQGALGLFTQLFEWADAGITVRFDAQTTGTPTKYAQRSPAFLVDSSFDETLRYATRAPPPPPGNWKPLLALVYTLGVLAGGAAGSRRLIDRYVPGRGDDRRSRQLRWAKLTLGEKFNELSIAGVEEKVHRDRQFTRILLMVPFAVTEAAIGAVSYATGVLRIPETGSWLPAGFWVNTILLAAGFALALAVWRRGYRMTEDNLLRLAATREGARKREA